MSWQPCTVKKNIYISSCLQLIVSLNPVDALAVFIWESKRALKSVLACILRTPPFLISCIAVPEAAEAGVFVGWLKFNWKLHSGNLPVHSYRARVTDIKMFDSSYNRTMVSVQSLSNIHVYQVIGLKCRNLGFLVFPHSLKNIARLCC